MATYLIADTANDRFYTGRFWSDCLNEAKRFPTLQAAREYLAIWWAPAHMDLDVIEEREFEPGEIGHAIIPWGEGYD